MRSNKAFDDHIEVKAMIEALQEKIGVADEIRQMLFQPKQSMRESLRTIDFFVMVKKVIIRSGGPERRLNLRVFIDLLRELRMKLDITKEGLVPEKVKSRIGLGNSDIHKQ